MLRTTFGTATLWIGFCNMILAEPPTEPDQLVAFQFGGPAETPHAGPAIAEKPPALLPSPPKSAVTKGSFTVWTDPQDPKPGKRYAIIVQIKVPKTVKKYPFQDLSGFIVGTDGYKQHFGGPTETGFVPVKKHTVRIKATIVPGAAQLVKDVIQIKSKLLNEEQKIEITF